MTIQQQEQHQQAFLSSSSQQQQRKQQQNEEGKRTLLVQQQQQEPTTDAHFVKSTSSHHLMDHSEHSHTSASSSSSFSLAGASAASDDLDNSFHFSELAVPETSALNSATAPTSVSFHRSILRNKNGSFSSSSHQQQHQQSARFSLEEPQIKEFERYSTQEFDDLFYDDDEIAQFQHEAWCEECGLDPKEFE